MNVSVRRWKNEQPHPSSSPGREAACRNSSVLGLIPLPHRPAPHRSRTKTKRMHWEENEEHLHLNGMFSPFHFDFSIWSVMTWLCVDWVMSGNPSSAELLWFWTEINTLTHPTPIVSLFFAGLHWSSWTPSTHFVMVSSFLPSWWGIILSTLLEVSIHVKPDHSWHSQESCYLKALQNIPTLAPWLCRSFSSGEGGMFTCLRSHLILRVQCSLGRGIDSV